MRRIAASLVLSVCLFGCDATPIAVRVQLLVIDPINDPG